MYSIIPYREYIEQWVKDWVKKQRESREKGIEKRSRQTVIMSTGRRLTGIRKRRREERNLHT